MGQKKVNNRKNHIFATVFLRSRTENIPLEKDGKIERDTNDLRPSPETFTKVRTELEKIGFNIISEGGGSFSIHSSRNHFEEVLGIKLSQKEIPIFEGKDQLTVKIYFTEEIIKVPDNLKDLVKRITLPKYPISSPTEPNLTK